MLDLRRDNVIAGPIAAAENAPKSRVVRLRAAGGEYDLACVGADQFCKRAPRVLHRGPGFLAKRVHGAGVSKVIPQVRKHRFQHTVVDTSRGTVVEINP